MGPWDNSYCVKSEYGSISKKGEYNPPSPSPIPGFPPTFQSFKDGS